MNYRNRKPPYAILIKISGTTCDTKTIPLTLTREKDAQTANTIQMLGIKVWTARMGLQFYSQVRLETETRNSIFNGQHAAANSWRTQKYWPGIWQQHYQGSRIYKMLHSFHTCDAHVGKTSQNCLTICFHVAFLFNDTLRLIGGQSKGIFTMRSAFRKAIVLTDMLILKCMSTAVFIFPHQTVI